MPSLSVLIGATSAFTVIIVAAVTLSITLSASLSAIEKLGLDSTNTLAELAVVKLDNYVARPRNAVLTVNSHTMGGVVPFPSEDPTWATADELAAIMRGAWRTAETASTVASILRDGTFIITQRNPRSPGLHMLQAVNVIRNNAIELRMTSTYIGNGSDSPASLLIGAATPSEFRVLFNPGNFFWFLTTKVFVDAQRLDAWIAPPIILQFGTGPPFLQLSLHAAAYNASNTSLGVLASGVTADALSTFLLESKISAGSHLFAVGPDLRVIATTHPADWYTIEADVPRNRTVLDPGCSSTITSTAAAPGTPVHWVCRNLLADHPFKPASKLMIAADGAMPAMGVRKMTLDGKPYFVSVRGSQLARTFGYLLTLLTLIPEEDVIGDVTRSTAIAIGTSAAVLILAVAVSCVIVVLLLKPLEDVADRMATAAALEDDDEAREFSGIAEVRQLQESFYALSDELKRVRSFVPATVLAGRFEAEDEEGDIDYGTSNSVITSERNDDNVSNRSKASGAVRSETRRSTAVRSGTRKSGVKSGTGSSHGAGGGLNVAAGLTERVVTIAMLDCEGFHDVVRKEAIRTVARMYQGFIEAVSLAVTDGHGVLDSFHGDRLLMTFNGARPIALHIRRGVTTALRIASHVVPATLKLRAHVGVATGRCRVGNVGGTKSMRFCIFGTAVSRAAQLAASGRTYAAEVSQPDPSRVAPGAVAVPAGSTVIVSGIVARDVETTFVTQSLDYTSLGRKALPELIAAVLAPVSEAANDDEWMYVLEKAAMAGGAAAKAELGLRMLSDNDLARAKELLMTAEGELSVSTASGAVPGGHPPSVAVRRLKAAIADKEGVPDAPAAAAATTTSNIGAALSAAASAVSGAVTRGGEDGDDTDKNSIFAKLQAGDIAAAKAAFDALPDRSAAWARALAPLFAAAQTPDTVSTMPGSVEH